MTSPSTDTATSAHAGDAGGPGAEMRPWYRRRAFFLTAGAVVVVAAAVVSDLPQHTSRSTELANAAAVVNEIKADVSPCSFAIREAFTVYGDLTNNSASVADRARVPALLRDDQAACSFTNSSIFALSNIEVPGSAAGSHLRQVIDSVTLWVTSDALAAIEAIQTLSTNLTDATAITTLGNARRAMSADRARVSAELHAAERVLGARRSQTLLPPLSLPATTH